MFSFGLVPDDEIYSPATRQRALSEGLRGFGSAILSRGYSPVPRGPFEGLGRGAQGFQSAFQDALNQGTAIEELKRRREREAKQDTQAETRTGLAVNADKRAGEAETRAKTLFDTQRETEARTLQNTQAFAASVKRALAEGRDPLADQEVIGRLTELHPLPAATLLQKDNKPDYMGVPEGGAIFDKKSGKFIQGPGGMGGGKPTDDMRELSVINQQRQSAGQPSMSMEQLYRAKRGADPMADMDTRKSQAAQLGIQPGSPQYQSFVLTGRMPREDQQPLSATDKKAIMEADESVLASQTAVKALDEAMELSKKAYTGPTAGARGYLGSLAGMESGEATANLNNLVMSNALGQLKSIFGAAPTEGERKILMEIQGSVNQPDKVRQDIFSRAKVLAQRRAAFNKQRADELRGGTFYKPGGDAPKQEAPDPLGIR